MGLRNSREVFLKRERTQWKWYIKYNSKASKETSIFRNSCASSFIITNRRLELHQDICLNETCNHLHHDHWFNVRTCLVQPTKKLRNLKSQFLQRIQAIAHRNQAHQDFQISLTGHISRSATSKCKIFHQAVARHLQKTKLQTKPHTEIGGTNNRNHLKRRQFSHKKTQNTLLEQSFWLWMQKQVTKPKTKRGGTQIVFFLV